MRNPVYKCCIPPEFCSSSASPQKGQTGNRTGLKRAKAMSESTIDPTEYRLHDKDTGSADYQVALLRQRIKHLTEHLGTHSKDFSSRRGLLTLVARRRKLLDFLKEDNEERYQKIVAGLGLRR